MTAAAIPSGPVPAAYPSRPPTDSDSHGRTASRTGPPAERRTRGMPYLAPVPDCEPPFDDEVGNGRRTRSRRSTATSVAGPVLRTSDAPLTPSHPALPPDRSPGLRRTTNTDVLVLAPQRSDRPTTISSAGVPPWSSEADVGVRKTTSEHLPPAKRAASVLARALVEVLSGRRPLAQLRVHCAPEIYAGLGERPPAPMALPHLLTVRVCEPADGVAEVSVAFRRADRVKALAFRIEGVDGRWRITALQLG